MDAGGGDGGGVAVVNEEDVSGDGDEPQGESKDFLVPCFNPELVPATEGLASVDESTASLDAVTDLSLELEAVPEELLLSDNDDEVSAPTAFFDWASLSLLSGSESTAGARQEKKIIR